jgi:hypothetical protein
MESWKLEIEDLKSGSSSIIRGFCFQSGSLCM